MSISIIIPAYKAAPFLGECLDSIRSQDFFQTYKKYEILIGVDACEETLRTLQEIKPRYLNLKCILMKENSGPYITRNTLLQLAEGEHLFFFDADDKMKSDLISSVLNTQADIVRFKWESFGNKKFFPKEAAWHAQGVFSCTRRVMDTVGGFQPWRCEADSEFHKRVGGSFEVKKLNAVLFYRRYTQTSLVQSSKYGYGSSIRKKYKELTKTTTKDLYCSPIVGEYKAI